MGKLLENIENYWDRRADGYLQTNLEELHSFKREAWIDLINEYAPKVSERKLKVLDIGTGPGFFALLMAGCGYEVVAVDYTEAMLQKAKENASSYKLSINFKRMDAHHLEFEKDTFDLIVTRNLTWNLERPDQAYKEWYRVLRSKGRLLNFDANWYLYVHDPQEREKYEQDRINSRERGFKDHATMPNAKVMEDIARNLPLSRKHRPEWDVQELLQVGFKKIIIEMEIGKRIWDEAEMVQFSSTPMFMIGAEK